MCIFLPKNSWINYKLHKILIDNEKISDRPDCKKSEKALRELENM